MVQKIIFTIGLPASGKSTWARNYIKDNPQFKIVCRDDLRNMLDDGYWRPKNEELVKQIQEKIILECLDRNYSVIVADTNLSISTIKRIKDVVLNHCKYDSSEIEFEEKSFLDVPVNECIKRDLARPNSVGSKVILDMASKHKINHEKPLDFNKDLPRAYIVDIDGTLAIMNGRNPFDWDLVDTDLPNNCVIETVRELGRTNKIIIMSGRDGAARTKTIEWLQKWNVPVDEFYMRKTGDMRKDYEVKKELYENVKDRYAIVGVFDDRPQVVRLWKELGLQVFDVGPEYEF